MGSSTDNAFIASSSHAAQLHAHHILQNGPLGGSRAVSHGSTSTANEAGAKKKRSSIARPKGNSVSSRSTNISANTRDENRVMQRDVRTLPPWIVDYEDGDEVLKTKPTDRLLSSPTKAHAPQHNHVPSTPNRRMSQDGYVDASDDDSGHAPQKKETTGFFGGHKDPVRGRKWDHARDDDPIIMQSGVLQTASPWQTYVKSSMYGPALNEDGRRVDEEFLRQQTPGYQKPWRGDIEGGDPEKLSGLLHNRKQQKTLMRRIQHTLLMHPLVPLGFRLTVLITSVIALGISASIHHLTNNSIYGQNPSTTMAIVVDVVAIPYILYITWDEYTGKPLGLRSPKAKIRLVLLDLWFIIFESANLALAFAALREGNGSCVKGGNGDNMIICDRAKALCAILLLALIAWSLTFAISIFRLVERVGGREDTD